MEKTFDDPIAIQSAQKAPISISRSNYMPKTPRSKKAKEKNRLQILHNKTHQNRSTPIIAHESRNENPIDRWRRPPHYSIGHAKRKAPFCVIEQLVVVGRSVATSSWWWPKEYSSITRYSAPTDRGQVDPNEPESIWKQTTPLLAFEARPLCSGWVPHKSQSESKSLPTTASHRNRCWYP